MRHRPLPGAQPPFVAAYAGDALWAAMIFCMLAFVRPGASTASLAVGALAIAAAVEASQLVHAPWLDALRGTTLGALALGQGFKWSDLLCYAVGVAVASGVDAALRRRRRA